MKGSSACQGVPFLTWSKVWIAPFCPLPQSGVGARV